MELPLDKEDIALFNAATRVHLGNGNKALFWSSRWLEGEAPATLFPALFKHNRRKNRTVKEALTGDRWVRDVDYNMTELIIAEFLTLRGYINDIELLPSHDDKITWLHTADGQYTAKSAYELQFIGMTVSMTAENTWRMKAPPKCRFFTWLMLQNRIWTAARLQLREWPNDYFCPLCVRNLETVSHLFQECCFSKMVWDKVGSWIATAALRPANWGQTHDIGQWFIMLSNSGQQTNRNAVRSLVMLTVWEIWKERNSRVFNKVSKSPARFLDPC